MKIIWSLVTALLLPAAAAVAQETPPPPPEAGGPGMAIFERAPGAGLFYTEMLGGEPVKGAPYSATAVTESTQVLADGNRIVNKQSGLVARDSEGRVRREENLKRLGPLAVEGGNIVFIHDPVARTAYILNPKRQTARVMKHDGVRMLGGPGRQRMRVKMAGGMWHSKLAELGEVKTESLGTQVIEGVNAEGTRETRTIPAGAIGNEKPIVITVETWKSPDLHVVVLRKRTDPRFGETVYRLTGIKAGEPDASLFQVPSGYKIRSGGMHRAPEPPPPPPPPGE